MVFRRKIYNKMLEWKKNSAGKTALLIEGARRVGKSTIVEEFAKNEYESYIFIDFYEASPFVKSLFDDLSDLNYIFLQLKLQYQVSLKERRSLIVFDEVQLCPKARSAIKALVKDGRYDYIETGSLISIKRNVRDILIPSEEQRITMFPMDYEEFRWSLGDNVTIPTLRELFQQRKPLGQVAHRKAIRDFRLYMLIGGMPQAVQAYIDTNDFSDVDSVKRNIISLYKDDFRKIDYSGKISALFDAIPAQLMGNASRYKVSSVISSSRAGTVLEQIAEMEDSKTVLVSYHANDPEIGLSQNRDLTKFKLFLADTGLFTTLIFADKSFTENDIYSKLLNDKLQANLGYLYENVVAQLLTANGHKLFYHTFPSKVSKNKYEIDFIISQNNKLCPIEVKSSGYKTHASIDAFQGKYASRMQHRYLIYTKDYQKDGDLECIPVYMTQFI